MLGLQALAVEDDGGLGGEGRQHVWDSRSRSATALANPRRVASPMTKPRTVHVRGLRGDGPGPALAYFAPSRISA